MFNFIFNHFTEIANIAMAIGTFGMVYYTKCSIDEMKITRKEANKANIVFYVEQKERNLNFIIKNIGNTMAYDVKIRSNPEFKYDETGEFNFDSIFKNTIPSFPPGFEIKVSYNDTIYLLNEEKNLKYTIHISFVDIYNNTVEEKFIIDFSYLKGLFPKVPNDIDSSLHNISDSLDQLIKVEDSNMKNLINKIKE